MLCLTMPRTRVFLVLLILVILAAILRFLTMLNPKDAGNHDPKSDASFTTYKVFSNKPKKVSKFTRVGSCDIDPCHRTACPPNLVGREGWEEHCCLDDTDSEGIHVYLKRIEPDRRGIDVPDLPAQFFQCGWPGMDEGTCLKRGCCWDDFIKSRNSGSSCYVKPGTWLPDELCPIEPSKRKQCGSDDITKKQCLRRSCCWDDIVPGATKCFEQPEPASGCLVGPYIHDDILGVCRRICHVDETPAEDGTGMCRSAENCCEENSHPVRCLFERSKHGDIYGVCRWRCRPEEEELSSGNHSCRVIHSKCCHCKS